MKAPTNIQILKDAKGKPAFAVIPYSEYMSLTQQHASTIPNAVVHKVINKDMTPIRAWREHLGLTPNRSRAPPWHFAQRLRPARIQRTPQKIHPRKNRQGYGDSAGAISDLRLV